MIKIVLKHSFYLYGEIFTLELRFLERGRILCQHAGGTLLLTYADKRGEGGQKSENFSDIICERSLTIEQRCYKKKERKERNILTHN